MARTKLKLMAHVAAIALCGVFQTGVAADTALDGAPAAPSGSEKISDKIDEITVTATKRTTSLQETPIAISAYSQATLDRDHVNDLADLTQFAPSLAFTTQGDQGALMITMRGIGNDNAYTELDSPEVALYVDGVYSSRPQGASTLFYDMDRVEVLRGPQGTLFGRNSTVGVIDLITAKPTLDGVYGNVQVGFGDYNAFNTKGMINVPVTNSLALRFAYADSQHDGYVAHQNPPVIPGVVSSAFVTAGPQYDSEDRKSARVSALYQPDSALTWNVSYEYYLDNGIPNISLSETPQRGQPFWSSLYQIQPNQHMESQSVRSQFDYSITDYVDLTYVAGWTSIRRSEDFETDYGLNLPTAITAATGPTLGDPTGNFAHNNTPWSRFDSYSNEVQFKSHGTHTIDWIVGGYQSKDTNAIRFDVDAYNGYNGPGNTFAWSGSFIQPHRTIGDRALFGQATWHVTDDLRATAGWRSAWDTEEDNGGRNITFAGCAAPYTYDGCGVTPQNLSIKQLAATGFYGIANNDASIHNEKNTNLLRFDYDITPLDLAYVSRATGYHPGRIADLGFSDSPETLTNYEIGLKDTLLDGRATLNSAAYFENFNGYQLTQVIATYNAQGQELTSASHQINTKGAIGYGLEEELTLKATRDDEITFTGALERAYLKGWTSCDGNQYLDCGNAVQGPGEVKNFKGNSLQHTPGASGTVTYDHVFTLFNDAQLIPRWSTHFETASYLTLYNDKGTLAGVKDPLMQLGYTESDFSLVYRAPDRRYTIEAFVKNIEDSEVKTSASTVVIGQGLNKSLVPVGLYAPPRTFGAQATLKF